MWPDPQEIADLVTFTKEILKNLFFCAVLVKLDSCYLLKQFFLANQLHFDPAELKY